MAANSGTTYYKVLNVNNEALKYTVYMWQDLVEPITTSYVVG